MRERGKKKEETKQEKEEMRIQKWIVQRKIMIGKRKWKKKWEEVKDETRRIKRKEIINKRKKGEN